MKKMPIVFLTAMLLVYCTGEQQHVSNDSKKSSKNENKTGSSVTVAPDRTTEGDLLDLTGYEALNSEGDEMVKTLTRKKSLKKTDKTGTSGDSSGHFKQPLYIIDGSPADNTRKASAGKWGEAEYKSATDLSTLEIKSIRTLTGEQAVEQYGERGKNGVIIITTKNGRKGDVSYMRTSEDTTYSREDAASFGMMELINGEKDERGENQ